MKIKIVSVGLFVLLFSLRAFSQSSAVHFEENLKESRSVVVAQIVCVGQNAGFWSGLFPAYQYVKYKVDRTLAGEKLSGVIGVNHYVVKGSKSSDKDTPRLNTTLFKKENKLVLFLKLFIDKNEINSPVDDACSGGKTADYLVFDSDFGAVEANDDTLRVIQLKNRS